MAFQDARLNYLYSAAIPSTIEFDWNVLVESGRTAMRLGPKVNYHLSTPESSNLLASKLLLVSVRGHDEIVERP